MKDKRDLLLLPLLLLPLAWLTIAFEAPREMADAEFNKLVPFFMRLDTRVPAIYCLATVVLVIIFIATYIKQTHTEEELVAKLLFVKVVHLITGVVMGLSLLMYANMRGLVGWISLFWWLEFSLILSGCFGFFILLSIVKSTRIRIGRVFLVGALQFVFVIDVISCLLLWLRLKKNSLDTGDVASEPVAPELIGEEIVPSTSPKKRDLRKLRYLLLLPGIFLPYSVFVTFVSLFILPPTSGQGLPIQFVMLAVTVIITIPLNLVFVMTGLGETNASEKMARMNMVVRLLQIPGYLINFFFAMLFMISIFTMSISLALASLDMLCLVATGILGTAAVTAAVKEGKMSVRAAFFASIFNYIYCLDVVYAIVLYVFLAAKRVGKRPFGRRKRLQGDPENKSAPAESLGD